MTFFKPIWWYQFCQWILRIWDSNIKLTIKGAVDPELGSNNNSGAHIKLVTTKDEKSIVVETRLLELSKVFKTMFELTENNTAQLVELPVQMNMKTLKRVIIGLQYFQESEEPYPEFLARMKKRKLIGWERKLMDLNNTDLDDLTIASNYLDIERLSILCFVKHAIDLRGMNTNQMRKRYGLVNDFTPEEMIRIKSERWVLKDTQNKRKIKEEATNIATVSNKK